MKESLPLDIIVLVQGILEDGSAHYAYASIPAERYVAFKQAEASGNYTIQNYGTVLAHGPGIHPPKDVMDYMYAEYASTHDFEEEALSPAIEGLGLKK